MKSPTFFSRCGEILSKTELKLCNGELPFLSFRLLGLDRLLLSDSFNPFLITFDVISRGGVMRGEFNCFTGEPSLFADRVKKPSVVLIGDIVRSGDNVIRCVINFIGDVGESRLCDLARVSAIKRLACSRSRAWRSSCCVFGLAVLFDVFYRRDDTIWWTKRSGGNKCKKKTKLCYKNQTNLKKKRKQFCAIYI